MEELAILCTAERAIKMLRDLTTEENREAAISIIANTIKLETNYYLLLMRKQNA